MVAVELCRMIHVTEGDKRTINADSKFIGMTKSLDGMTFYKIELKEHPLKSIGRYKKQYSKHDYVLYITNAQGNGYDAVYLYKKTNSILESLFGHCALRLRTSKRNPSMWYLLSESNPNGSLGVGQYDRDLISDEEREFIRNIYSNNNT